MTNRSWWTVLAVVLLAFALFEGIKYGAVAGGVLLAGLLLPAATDLAGGRGALHRAVHGPWGPLVAMLVSIAVPLPALGWGLRGGLELFLLGLAWLLHVAVHRTMHRADPGAARRRVPSSV